MEQRSISGLIKEVPAWHLLQRASDLSKIALVLQKGGLCEMKCGACLAEDIIYSALEAFYNPGRAGEANQFDMRHFSRICIRGCRRRAARRGWHPTAIGIFVKLLEFYWP